MNEIEETMEVAVTSGIIERYFCKLKENLCVDCAIVGGGPSGLLASILLARAGKRVAVFERKLAPGGGIWGGAMLFNEVVIQANSKHLLDNLNIACRALKADYFTVDAVELSAGLIYHAVHSGVAIFNSVTVADVVVHSNQVCGVVINWTPVDRLDMHVDPLVVMARTVLDGTGHPSELANLVTNKADLALKTVDGKVQGERPMWMNSGERTTVENTCEIYPGLFASGMAANNVFGGFRMGPIFGGMLLSGEKVATLIEAKLNAGG